MQITIRKGSDHSEVIRLAKNARTRLSDYAWLAHLRRTITDGTVVHTLTEDNGGLLVTDDLAGDITITIGKVVTVAMNGTYVLDLRATNKGTELVEYTDVVAISVVPTVTRPEG